MKNQEFLYVVVVQVPHTLDKIVGIETIELAAQKQQEKINKGLELAYGYTNCCNVLKFVWNDEKYCYEDYRDYLETKLEE